MPTTLSSPALSGPRQALLQLAARHDGVLVAQAATDLGVSRGCAGAHLRQLEHAGLLDAELVAGGRLRYTLSGRGELVLTSALDRQLAGA